MEEYSRILAEFVSDFDRRDIPDAVIERTQQSILNGVAAALSACRVAPVEILLAVLGENGKNGDSRLFGRPETLDLLNAVLINAYMAHFNDYDDTHIETVYHTNPSNVPALLGLAANRHLGGEEALTSLALGLEASIRLGVGLGRVHYAIGWHTTGTLGTVGCALTSSRLLGLDAKRTNNALGLALTQAAGLRGLMFGSMAKGFNSAKAAYNGLLGALLAERSFTAAENSIEGGLGYANAASRTNGTLYIEGETIELDAERAVDLERITDGLGKRWETELIAFKPYASGVATHASIDAVLALRKEIGLDEKSSAEEVARTIRQIKSITMHIPIRSLDLPRKRDIDEPVQAKFSMYNVPAIVLVRGRAGPAEYNDAVLTDPTIEYLRQMIELSGDPKLGIGNGALTAELDNGRRIEINIDFSLGTPQRPLDSDTLRRKLFDAAENVLDHGETEQLADALAAFDQIDDLDKLMRMAAK